MERVNAAWRKSSYSGSRNCVEAAQQDGMVKVRDTKHGEQSPVLAFTPGIWRRFTDQVKSC
jgi:hypothetical protein